MNIKCTLCKEYKNQMGIVIENKGVCLDCLQSLLIKGKKDELLKELMLHRLWVQKKGNDKDLSVWIYIAK